MDGADGEEQDGDLLIRAVAADEGVLGDPRRFGPVAAAVAAAARGAGATEALVVALRAMAWCERHQLANTRALVLLDEAATIARRARLGNRLGEVLVCRAAVGLELGRVRAAARDLVHAAELVEGPSAPDLDLKRAALLQNLGRVGEAADAYRSVLAHPDATTAVRTRAANNLALAESLRGRSDVALQHIDLAVGLAPETGPVFVGVVAHNRGVVLARSGRVAEGLRQFDAATALLVAAGVPLGEFLVEHAETLAAVRALPEARELGERAVAELERHDVPLMAAEALLRVADIALLAGDHDAAHDAAARAAARFRRQRRSGWTALATVVAVEAALLSGRSAVEDVDRACRAAAVLTRQGNLSGAVSAELVTGRAAQASGRAALARRRWRSAYARSRSGPFLVRLRGRLAAALAATSDDDARAVLAHCRAGLAELDRHRAALASTELRALASWHGVELGRLGLDVVLRSGSAARVFDWTERTRAAALLPTGPPAPADVAEERAALAALQGELAEARRDTGLEPRELLARQASAEDRIRRATWRRRAAGAEPGTARSAPEVRALLHDRTLVSFVRHRDGVLAVVLDAAGSRLLDLGPLAPLRFESDALLFALRRLTRPGRPAALAGARASAEHALARLRRLVVDPLGLDPLRGLVVVPTADTHRVPWSALHDGPVAVAPSASSWAAARTRAGGVPPSVLVVAGPGLPGAERETEVVAAQHAAPVVLSPPGSTPGAVLDAMASADLVHLACHGSLRIDNPLFSALHLTEGPLTLHELDLRGTAPRRIVLAACDSAAGVAYAGDEVLGFVAALLSRGAAGLVASVVPVGDVESVGLMGGLHRGLAAGLTTADALHAARGGLDLDDPRQFVNWCGYTAYGAA